MASPRHDADLTPPLGTGFQTIFAPEVQKYDVFLHISENVDFDTPYTFFFFGFLSLCYGAVGDAAGFTGLRHSADPFSSSEGKVHGSVGSFRWKDLLNCLCVVTRGIVFLVRFECVTLCRHPLFWPSQNRVLSF